VNRPAVKVQRMYPAGRRRLSRTALAVPLHIGQGHDAIL
jgi:hypothetical protein